MKKIIASILLGVATLIPSNFSEEYKEIYNALNDCYKIEITIDNKTNEFDKNSEEFMSIIETAVDMLENAHEMPAFGVSLDNETRQAKKQGTWLEIYFKGVNTHNEMPFERLLIEVNPEWTGFNIIRYYDGKYDGRCFYIDLVDNNMSELYNLLNNI